jgi:hypothetical protein
MMVDVVGVVILTLLAYAALVRLSASYSRRTHWEPPEGSPDPDGQSRRQMTFAVGALAAGLGAICVAVWVGPWPARLVLASEAALMAATGASDLRRFQLPLPFTLLGICLALAAYFMLHTSIILLAFGLAWAAVIMVLHALTTKGSMQLGDHITTLWIALAVPFNGPIAIVLGDLANAVLALVKDLRGRKVAAAGMWLVSAAVLVALPPYLSWFIPAAQTSSPQDEIVRVPLQITPTITPEQAMNANALITLSEWAGDRTGRVGLVAGHAARIADARQAAGQVASYAAMAKQIAPQSEMTLALQDLVTALQTYDVAEVRDASARMAEQRELLAPIATAYPTPPVEVSSAVTQTQQETQ